MSRLGSHMSGSGEAEKSPRIYREVSFEVYGIK